MRPTLNPRHALFVRHYRKTNVAARAYLMAGYRPASRNSLDAAASRLLRHHKVQLRIRELDRQMAERTRVTVESLTDDLNRIMQGAEADKQYAAAKGAVDTKAKLHGHLIDRKETGAPGDFASMQNAGEVLDLVRKELGDEAADALAAVFAKKEAEEVAETPADQPELDAGRSAEDRLN